MKLQRQLPMFVLFLPLAMGANGGGCGAEYQPGDGDAESWSVGAIPNPESVPRPMSREWLEGDNCWKQLVKSATDCVGDATGVGRFDSLRQQCTYESGQRLLLGGPISTPSATTTTVVAVEWRTIGRTGTVCATGKILGIGRTILDVQGKVALLESPTVTSFRLTCPDGKTYANDVEGIDPDIGSKWLAHRTPGVLMTCRGNACELGLWGGPDGEAKIAVCESPNSTN